MEICTEQLEIGVEYPIELDLPEQHAALMSLFNSTGGPNWDFTEAFPDDRIFFKFVSDLTDYSNYVTRNTTETLAQILSNTNLTDLPALSSLSGNCTFQQSLAFGEYLYKHYWGKEGRSYCQWHGVTCCKSLVS